MRRVRRTGKGRERCRRGLRGNDGLGRGGGSWRVGKRGQNPRNKDDWKRKDGNEKGEKRGAR